MLVKEKILSLIPKEKQGAIVGDELFFECPNPEHDDENYTNCSINLKTGLYYCFVCGEKGNLKKLSRIYKSSSNNMEYDPFKPAKQGVKRSWRIW